MDKPAQVAVLLIEDDHDLREILAATLRGFGFLVHSAARVREALEICRREPIQVAVLHAEMAGIDLPSILSALKEAAPGIACCLMSADGSTESIAELRRQGAASVVQMPFYPDHLRDMICEAARPRSDCI